jgi:hypothetical protein
MATLCPRWLSLLLPFNSQEMNPMSPQILSVKFFRLGVLALPLLLSLPLQAASCDPNTERFVADGEETVIDAQTLLMWRRCPEGLQGDHCQKGSLLSFNWRQGVERLAKNNADELAGYGDWAIPTLSQLQTLTDAGPCAADGTSQFLLASWPEGYFWSRSSEKGKAYLKRTFSLAARQPALSNQGTYGIHLWLVRRVE